MKKVTDNENCVLPRTALNLSETSGDAASGISFPLVFAHIPLRCGALKQGFDLPTLGFFSKRGFRAVDARFDRSDVFASLNGDILMRPTL